MIFSTSTFSTSPFSTLLDAFIEARAEISALSLLNATFQIQAEFGGLLEILAQTSFGSNIQFYGVADTLSNSTDVNSNGNIIVGINSELNISSEFTLDYIINAIGLSDFVVDSSFNAKQYIDILNGAALQSEADIYSIISSINENNSAQFDVVGLIVANLAEVNQDIVYYIVYADKVKSFNLTIVRAR